MSFIIDVTLVNIIKNYLLYRIEVNKINKILIILLIFGCKLSFTQQYWINQPSPAHYLLTRCVFIDSTYGWVAGDSGTVIHTSNGGVNWNLQNTGITDYAIEDIFFLNRRLGWAIANDFYYYGTFILKTTNGGGTWSNSRFPDTTLLFRTVCFTDSLTGFLGDFTGKILKTTDGGNNWSRCSVDSNVCAVFTVKKINFLNAQTGFACGGHMDIAGVIWRTTNSGLNWQVFCVSPEPMNDIVFSNGRVVAVGGDYEYGSMAVTGFNSSVTWDYSPTGCFGIAQTVSFRTPSEAWAPLGYFRLWAVSADSAKPNSWLCIAAPDSTAIYGVSFISPTNGWAFGSSGRIYKYNPGIIGINNGSNSVPGNFILYQNYPNPFNPSTTIKFYLPKSGYVTLIVFDAAGREVRVLVNKTMKSGEQSVEFDADKLPSGIYFYQLTAHTGMNDEFFSQTKKMVLIK